MLEELLLYRENMCHIGCFMYLIINAKLSVVFCWQVAPHISLFSHITGPMSHLTHITDFGGYT